MKTTDLRAHRKQRRNPNRPRGFARVHTSLLTEEEEALFDRHAAKYFGKERWTMRAAYEDLCAVVHEANLDCNDPAQTALYLPSLRSFQRRVNQLPRKAVRLMFNV